MNMKRFLLPENGTFYKANLHCHSTVSDGKWSPQQIKNAYQSQGYSVVAYTDHEVIVAHPELKDASFLPLNGVEIEIPTPPNPDGLKRKHRVHLCLIAKEEDNLALPTYDYSPNAMAHDPEIINAYVADAKENGFFVTCNHPGWSFEDVAGLMQYKGLDALEIYNTSCVMQGYDDDSSAVYRALSRRGIRMYPVAADDNHNRTEFGSPQDPTCGGWVQIKAEKLEYRVITKALEQGAFYASNGPEIHTLWVEDRQLHVRCSPANRICVSHLGGKCLQAFAESGPLTEAEFALDPSRGGAQVTVYDEKGKFAATRFYYPEEW